MNQYTIDTRIKDGYLTIKNLPIRDELDVKIIIIPKINFNELSFKKVRELTKAIKENFANDIASEREKE